MDDLTHADAERHDVGLEWVETHRYEVYRSDADGDVGIIFTLDRWEWDSLRRAHYWADTTGGKVRHVVTRWQVTKPVREVLDDDVPNPAFDGES